MATLKELEREIGKIKQRNKKVEADKAWETSTTRKAIISIFTYLPCPLPLGHRPARPLGECNCPHCGFLIVHPDPSCVQEYMDKKGIQ